MDGFIIDGQHRPAASRKLYEALVNDIAATTGPTRYHCTACHKTWDSLPWLWHCPASDHEHLLRLLPDFICTCTQDGARPL